MVWPATGEHPLAFLKLLAVWMCFSFFFWSTCTLSAIQSGPARRCTRCTTIACGDPLRRHRLHMLAGPPAWSPVVFVARARSARTRDRRLPLAPHYPGAIATGCGLVAAVVASAAGSGTGMAGPSRDMPDQRAAPPPGATGRVYGHRARGWTRFRAPRADVRRRCFDRGAPTISVYGAALMLLFGVASASLSACRSRTRGAAGGPRHDGPGGRGQTAICSGGAAHAGRRRLLASPGELRRARRLLRAPRPDPLLSPAARGGAAFMADAQGKLTGRPGIFS